MTQKTRVIDQLLQQTKEGKLNWEPMYLEGIQPVGWRTKLPGGCRLELHTKQGGVLFAFLDDEWGVIGRYPATDDLGSFLNTNGRGKMNLSVTADQQVRHQLLEAISKIPNKVYAPDQRESVGWNGGAGIERCPMETDTALVASA